MRNAEQTLPRALNSLNSIADEILVMDTGSDDASRQIVQDLGHTLVNIPWSKNFAKARNLALKRLHRRPAKWILSLDADEALTEQTRSQLLAWKSQGLNQALQNQCAQFQEHSNLQGVPVFLGQWPQYPSEAQEPMGWKPLIFPNTPDLRYLGRVHEVLYHRQQRINFYPCTGLRLHHNPQHWSHEFPKRQRDFEYLQMDIHNPNPLERFHVLRNLAQWYHLENQLEEACRHFEAAWLVFPDLPEQLMDWGKPVVGALMQQASIANDEEACQHWLKEYLKYYAAPV